MKKRTVSIIAACTLLITAHSSIASASSIFFKTAFVVAGTAGLTLLKREYDHYKQNLLYRNLSVDAEEYPELNNLFLKIKDDLGIKEHVKLRIITPELDEHISERKAEGFYNYYDQSVYILIHELMTPSKLIHNIAHELEHHRQWHNYPGSFPFSHNLWTRNEFGADMAAARYQRCYDCLTEVANDALRPHEPHDTPYGHLTTATGYFSTEGYRQYIEQARADGAQCLAHKNGTHLDPNTPLKDFLPIT